MLPEPYRLHHHSDFSRTVRRGHRIGRRDFVVHACSRLDAVDNQAPVAMPALVYGGPRFGLIVSKAVGPAVVRHRVARQLRHISADLAPIVRDDVDIVIRAFAGSAVASSADLARQLRSGLAKLDLLVPGSTR